MITVPYSPAFNIPKYSICATVKVLGFYTGTCQANVILTRGKTGTGTGNYQLYFADNPADSSCTSVDTTKDVFYGMAEARPHPHPFAAFDYTPHIVEGIWYKVIATFDDTSFNTYVNGTLKTSVSVTTPGIAIATSTDSISIGYNVFESSFPYPFKGVIDDIQLFDRVLSDTEINQYSIDTCGPITLQQVSTHFAAGGNSSYTVASSMTYPYYQWQVNTGAGFINLSNVAPYSGVTTDTLHISGTTIAMNSYQFRCVVSNIGGCRDTSASALLSLGIDNPDVNSLASVFPNPAHNIVSISLRPELEGAFLQLFT